MENVCASLVNELFGKKMSALRRMKGVSQAVLGKRIGRTRATIANLEAGDQNVQLHQVYSIAVALDLPIEQFLPAVQEVLEVQSPSRNPDELFLQSAMRQLMNTLGGDNENT